MSKHLSLVVLTTLLLAGCQTPPKRDTYNQIGAEVDDALKARPPAPTQADAVASALLPPVAQLGAQLPKARAVLDERFNVSFNNVPVQQFYNSIVAGTRYNMLINPEVTGTITANLKDVTLFEALEAVRELYGYDYKIDGTRIYIRPLTMQTKMFKVNYLTASRKGVSSLRVSSTSVANSGTSNSGSSSNGNNGYDNAGSNGNNSGNNGSNNDGSNGNNGNRGQRDAAAVQTTSASDFWLELKTALDAIVDSGKDGRSVTISPQSGVIVIRAMPDELRNVDEYLRATQVSVDRQVILEAKILEVELNSNFQSGINWAAFGKLSTNSRIAAGMVQPGTALAPLGANNAGVSVNNGSITATPGSALGAASDAMGSLFGLAFQTSNFAALISFLEGQGTVHVLSSPRIATLNNQKALLKIGTDEFFVTGVSTTTNSNTNGTGVTTPSVTLQPFFSGVVLDVTPQIDDAGNIILHVHPSVSQVSTVNKAVNLGVALGSLSLPLASSSTSEMDSIVRGQNGQVVAIGGLMRQSTTSDRSGVPGIGGLPVVGALFRSSEEVVQKRELVVLIKPTVIESTSDWNHDLLDSSRRIKALDPHRGEGRP
ncbi:general secretion pathway protein GspD [Duganella sp. Leaf126]|uniref:pilus (MSHA type) biogenesis protein MshL n=1 Tax=Duganella sp. Leaf126 TaxID=1736266 RepID=UPI0006F943ED|nr:pilus (MSHA type) biogenesis protein MshL [Duganella sp. Leaf126]KQQ40332.1 general secretion pathway protein GspD [Duganella sp. Leaf126]